MADPLIRVLHASHWLVGKRGPHPKLSSALDQLADLLAGSPVDYLVFSGNITASGSREDFEQAEELLVKFVRRAVGKAAEGDFGNRVVLAPGEYDWTLPGSPEGRLAEFNRFAQRVRSKLNGREDAPVALARKAPVIHELKDCTFIIAAYGDQQDFDDDLVPLLTDAAGKLLAVEYRRHTPTILVSSASPLLTWASRARLNGQVTSTAEKLGIDFHLFGGSPVFVLPYEPFVYRHVAIATGPRESQAVFPLRVNILTLQASDKQQADAGGDRRSRTWEFQLSTHEKEDDRPWSEPWTISEPHRFRSRCRASKSVGDSTELRKAIESWLPTKGKDAIARRLEHVPGSGTREWIASLDGGKINGWKVSVKQLPASNRGDDRRFRASAGEGHYPELKEAIEAVAHEKRTGKHLIVFDDQTYNEHDTQEAALWLQQLWIGVIGTVVGEKVKFLYLVTPKFSENEFERRFAQPIRARQLKDLGAVLQSHHCLVPFDTDELERWAGGMATLATGLLESTEEVFDSWSGSRELHRSGVSELLNIALGSGRAREMLQRCQSAILRMNGGVELLKEIAAELPRNGQSGGIPEPWLLPLDTVRRSQLLVELLAAQGLLERLESGRFRVRAASVFATPTFAESEPPPPTPARAADRSGCEISLFYANEDRPFVTRFAEHMRPVASRLNVEVWYDREIDRGNKEEKIEWALENCRAAVFFSSSHSVDPKGYPGRKELPWLKKRLAEEKPLTAYVIYVGPASTDIFFNRLNDPDRTLRHIEAEKNEVELDEVLARCARIIGENLAPVSTEEE